MLPHTPLKAAMLFKRCLATGLLLLTATSTWAQVERTDSLKKLVNETAKEQNSEVITPPKERIQHSGLSEASATKTEADLSTAPPMTYEFHAPIQPTHITALPFLDLGASHDVMPGLGEIRRATASYSLTANRWLFDAAVSGEKYKFQTATFNNFTLGGGLTYRLSDQWSLSAFGTYSTGRNFYSMAAYPFISQSQFGGTMNYQGEKFGVRLGARRMYDPFSRRWITEPIIAPNVKVGKMKMEMDIGPLVLDMLRHVIEKSRSYNPNMPIMPVPPTAMKP